MAATLQRKSSGQTNSVIVTKDITKGIVPRNYFVIISARMVINRNGPSSFPSKSLSTLSVTLDEVLCAGKRFTAKLSGFGCACHMPQAWLACCFL